MVADAKKATTVQKLYLNTFFILFLLFDFFVLRLKNKPETSFSPPSRFVFFPDTGNDPEDSHY